MREKLSKKDFNRIKMLFNPKAFSEIMFPNLENLSEMGKKSKFSTVRTYQLHYLSYEYMIANQKGKSIQELHEKKVGSGKSYAIGGRLSGKSAYGIKVDILQSLSVNRNQKSILASYDDKHVDKITKDVFNALDNHPFLRHLNCKVITAKGDRSVTNQLGNTMRTINENILGKQPGHAWFGDHVHKIWYDEFSMTNEEASNIRLMCKSERGEPIYRIASMTNFNTHSPAGEIFFNKNLAPWIVNYPAYANPTWTAQSEENAVKRFGSHESVGYRVNIDGEVLQNSETAFAIDKVRENYDRTRQIKSFIVNKKNFSRFRQNIVITRPEGIERVEIGGDIGENLNPSEWIIVFKNNDNYNYVYNITTLELTADQEIELVEFLINKLSAEVVAWDATEYKGKHIFEKLSEKYEKERLFPVYFNEKMKLCYEKDVNGNIMRDEKGQMKVIEEFVSVYSVARLKEIFYNKKITMPVDEKFDLQINNFVSCVTGLRETFDTADGQDHLIAAFRAWAVGDFMSGDYSFKNKLVSINHYQGMVF